MVVWFLIVSSSIGLLLVLLILGYDGYLHKKYHRGINLRMQQLLCKVALYTANTLLFTLVLMYLASLVVRELGVQQYPLYFDKYFVPVVLAVL